MDKGQEGKKERDTNLFITDGEKQIPDV